MKRCFLLIISLYFLLLTSCEKNQNTVIELPPTPPLSRSIGFALLINSYSQLADRPGEGGISIGLVRRGSILPVSERQIVMTSSQAERWIKVDWNEGGWLPEREVVIYDSAAAARTAAERLAR